MQSNSQRVHALVGSYHRQRSGAIQRGLCDRAQAWHMDGATVHSLPSGCIFVLQAF